MATLSYTELPVALTQWIGPTAPVRLKTPSYLRERALQLRRHAPEFIDGRAFFDPANPETTVAVPVVEELGMMPSSSDQRDSLVYVLEITLVGAVNPRTAKPEEISWLMPCRAKGVPYPESEAREDRVILHFGLDLLNRIRYSYDGPKKVLELGIEIGDLIF